MGVKRSMCRLACYAVAATLAAVSLASARPNTTTMSCAEAAATVTRAGAITLSTGPYTYDRFVASVQYCQLRQQTEPAYAPTRDSAQCQVGFRCRRPGWFPNNK
jgi:hypothetical protein